MLKIAQQTELWQGKVCYACFIPRMAIHFIEQQPVASTWSMNSSYKLWQFVLFHFSMKYDN